jgi:Fe-S oxidoreductase
MSPRGWFRIITSKDFKYDEAEWAVETSLNCKLCKYVCQAGADVTAAILEQRALHPDPFLEVDLSPQDKKAVLTSFAERAKTPVRSWTEDMLNSVSPPVYKLLSHASEGDGGVILPSLRRKTLREEFKDLAGKGGNVAYFYGCMTNLLSDGVGEAVIDILRKNKVDLSLPEQKCCGSHLITHGYTQQARDMARFNIDSLLKYEKVVTSCPWCTSEIKEYADLFPEEDEYRDKAQKLAGKVYDFSEFLVKELKLTIPIKEGRTKQRRVTYHDPCRLQVIGVTEEPRRILKSLPHVEFVEMENADRCCGFAGTYAIKYPDMSEKIFEGKDKALYSSGADILVTSCPYGIIQFKNKLKEDKQVLHIAQLLREAYLS